MTAYLESLLLAHFEAQGLPDAKHMAHAITVEFDKRDQNIYDFRAHHSEQETGDFFGLAPRTVRHIVRQQLSLKRSIA